MKIFKTNWLNLKGLGLETQLSLSKENHHRNRQTTLSARKREFTHQPLSVRSQKMAEIYLPPVNAPGPCSDKHRLGQESG